MGKIRCCGGRKNALRRPSREGDSVTEPEPPPSEANASGSPGRWRRWRRYIGAVVAILGTFGILGAIGSRAVDQVFTSAEKRINPEKPVLVSVREDPQGGVPPFFLASRSAEGLDAALEEVADCDELFAAAKRAGAVDVAEVKEALLLEGGTSSDLSIVDLRAKILKRGPPLDGARIHCEGAGALAAIGVVFLLDEQQPVAREMLPTSWDSNEPPPEPIGHECGVPYGEPYFGQGNIVRLEKGETQPFLLAGVSTSEYVEWEVEADVIIDGEAQTITINNEGEPFRVTGPKNPSGYRRYYEWQWYEQPPRMWIDDHPSPMAGHSSC